MLPEKVFEQMNGLGLTSEQSIGVAQLLFQSVETMTEKIDSTIDKMMDRIEATIAKMNANFAQQLLTAVTQTEEKIFARIAEEARLEEEKKLKRREAIAARKAGKAEKSAKEGVAAEAGDMFHDEAIGGGNGIKDFEPNSALKKAKLERFFKYIGRRVNEATEWATRKELGDYVKVYVAEQRFFAAEEFAEEDPDLMPEVKLMEFEYLTLQGEHHDRLDAEEAELYLVEEDEDEDEDKQSIALQSPNGTTSQYKDWERKMNLDWEEKGILLSERREEIAKVIAKLKVLIPQRLDKVFEYKDYIPVAASKKILFETRQFVREDPRLMDMLEPLIKARNFEWKKFYGDDFEEDWEPPKVWEKLSSVFDGAGAGAIA